MDKCVGFLYPGQGSQHVGMGLEFFENYPIARRRFGLADDLLGYPLSQLCFEGPEENLASDLNAQLAIYTVSCIITDLLKSKGVVPDIVSGYSSGFYAAAYSAGCFDFEYGLELVLRAGEILLDEGRKIDGSMAVIFGLALKEVREICSRIGEIEVAIQNTPSQTIISGTNSAIKKAIKMSTDHESLDAYTIPAATSYHSSSMKKASARLLGVIKDEKLAAPQVPLISYSSLDRIKSAKDLKHAMASQLSQQVLWVDLIRKLKTINTRLLIEVGPGEVIYRTVRWIERSFKVAETATESSVLKSVEMYRGLE